MTPEEAVDKLIARGLITKYVGPVQTIIEAVQATAKAEAKATETWRCAGIARNITQGETGMHYGEETAKKILRTGGLKVEV